MNKEKQTVHPYIPNSAPKVKAEMMKDIGIENIDELYEDIPDRLRFKRDLNIPDPIISELSLKREVNKILAKNSSCDENISFLGGGVAQHYVPAICDEITGRAEFLTAYAGEPYEDHGRFQALFEYESLMAELLDMEVVNVPTYDWGQAVSTSIRMAGRIAKRDEMLVSEAISPDRFLILKNYCEPVMKITTVKHNAATGKLDLDDFKSKLSDEVAGIYIENPTYMGVIQDHGQEIADLIHQNDGIFVVGTDPSSLGILTPPARYGADIVCGDIQGLGNHMYYGGALGGFIATRDEEKYIMEFPSRLFGICKTEVEGEWGFGDVTYDRTSFGGRENGKEFIGTAAALYGISSAVYLSLMGPKGMQELGLNIIQKSQYTMKKFAEIEGVTIKYKSSHFKEFVIDFSGTGKSYAEINQSLLKQNIFGGKDLSSDFDNLKDCALFCVTEVLTQEDIDTMIDSVKAAVR